MILRLTVGLVATLLLFAVIVLTAYLAIFWTIEVVIVGFVICLLCLIYQLSCQFGDFIMEKFHDK